MSAGAGTVIADRYELFEVIGTGGQATVYRARDRQTQKGVAVKVLSANLAEDPQHAARLAREQSALVALAGTSAVAVYDLCRAPDGSFCLVMELLQGTDLEAYLSDLESKGERLPLARLSAIAEPIVDTLERAHDAEIIHRDIKPANIFLLSAPAGGGGVRLLDFGLSWVKTATRLTLAGTVLGSPSYIAPEVWRGRTDELDWRVDVYSLGVILFRALTGHLPFEEAASLPEKLKAVTTGPRPSLHALRPDLPAQVDAWIERALAIDRKDRYQGVRELWTGLLSAIHYTPPLRSQRPIADSIVGAWRVATSAFWTFIEGGPSSGPGPTPPSAAPKRPPEDPEEEWIASPTEEPWLELGDADLEVHSERPPRAPTQPPPRASTAAAAPSAAPAPAPPVAPAADPAPLPSGPIPSPSPSLASDVDASKKSGKRSRKKKRPAEAAAPPSPSSPQTASSPRAADEKKKKRKRRKSR